MSDTKFTQGPWTVLKHSWSDTAIIDADGRTVCKLTIPDDIDEDDQDGLEDKQAKLAKFISAAPDLYAALELTRGNVASLHASHPNVWGHWLAVINAVLAKATKEPT